MDMKEEKEFLKYLDTIRQIAAEEGYDSLNEIYVEHLKCRFFGQDVMIGKSARVCLREMKLEDLEAFYGFWREEQDPVLTAFIKETPEESKEYLQAYIEYMYPLYDYGIWTAERIADGEVIGICGLGRTEMNGAECTDLGYYICPKCRNQGFASECVEIVLDYAKNYLEIPVICAIIKEENRISAGILRKFGFECKKKYEKSGEKLSVYQKEQQ